jgi:Mg-chelatase subunit ChlD
MKRLLVILSLVAAAAIALAVYLWTRGGGLPGMWLFGRRVEVLHPRWLYLIALAPLTFVALTRTLVDLPRAQQALSGSLRALLLAVLAVALARPSTIGERKTVATVLLVDVSDSVGARRLGAARKLVEDARAARHGDDVLRLVTFGSRPRLIDLPPDGEKLPADALARHDADGSDLSAALAFSYGLYPAGTIRRAVLISDGNETTGNVSAEAQSARERGVRVDVIALGPDEEDEVLVRELRLPAEVRIGQPFEVTAEIYATRATTVAASLWRDEFLNPYEGKKTLQLQPGANLVKWKSEIAQAGVTNYKLALAVTDANFHDHFSANNTAVASVAIHGRPRVLYVEGELASSRYLANALGKENIDVEVRGPYGLPSSATELAKYDLVLVSDVPSMFVGSAQMGALETYVKDLGGGFIMTGGQNSFGSGGWSGTRMESFLPVRFETEKKRDQPQLALVLCIDKSGSMQGEKMDLAKQAAVATAGVLGPDDLLSVIGFDAVPVPVVRLQRAANRTAIQRQISSIQASGGTNILQPLKMAYDELQGAEAKIKHVILLTDGVASYEGIPELVDEMASRKITVSAVGVGAEADRTLLTTIAERGNGRYYFTQDAQSVPRIFTKETSQVQRSSLVEEPIGVRIVRGSELLAGVGLDSAPPLRGYVATRPKPLSEVLVETTRSEPLLARWRQGLGQVVVFTSDVKNRWAIDWLRWAGYGKFWAQLVRSAMRPQQGGGGGLVGASFNLKVDVDPPRAKVALDAVGADDKFLSGLDGVVEVKEAGSGKPIELPLRQTASGRYEADLRLDKQGSFVVRTLLRRDGQVVGDATSTLSLPYPREYLALPADESLLRRVASITAGRSAPTPAQLFDPGNERVRFERDLWPWLLWIAAALLALDIASRRIQLNPRPQRR